MSFPFFVESNGHDESDRALLSMDWTDENCGVGITDLENQLLISQGIGEILEIMRINPNAVFPVGMGILENPKRVGRVLSFGPIHDCSIR